MFGCAGEAFENIETVEDVDELLETHEALTIFATVMAKLSGQFVPKSGRGGATRKR